MAGDQDGSGFDTDPRPPTSEDATGASPPAGGSGAGGEPEPRSWGFEFTPRSGREAEAAGGTMPEPRPAVESAAPLTPAPALGANADNDEEEDPEVIGRRKFLARVTFAATGVITLGMGIPAFTYVFDPARARAAETNWLSLGPSARVEVGIPTLLKAKIERKAGWVTQTEELAFYLLTENGRDYSALSNVCTHLGCRVRWISEQGNFFCPCHNAVFSKAGEVVQGPPPAPLETFEAKVEDGQILVKLEV